MQASIIIPTYNRADYLGRAIDSVLPQLEEGDELIVVDDGSQDETPGLLAGYGERTRVLRTTNGGAGRARNLGIAEARNDLVAFLDSDDWWLPGKLRLQRAFMERRPDLLFCFTNFEVELRDGSVHHRYLERWPRDRANWQDAFGPATPFTASGSLPEGKTDFPVYEGDLYLLQLTGLYVLTDTLMVRRQEAGAALHFAEDLSTYEDLECFFRLSQRGKAAFLDVETVRQVDHGKGRLSQVDHLVRLDARLTLMQRIWGADAVFLARHAEAYRHALDNLLQQRAGLLIAQGRSLLARESLARMSAPPLSLRLLARLPGDVLRGVLGVRRKLRRRDQVREELV